MRLSEGSVSLLLEEILKPSSSNDMHKDGANHLGYNTLVCVQENDMMRKPPLTE